MDTRKFQITILIAIVITGGFFRISGADWAFPILGHPDEATIVKPAITLVDKGGWDPNNYLRPNHFSIYLNSVAYRILNPIFFDTPIIQSFHKDPNFFYLTARLLSGVFGLLLIPVAYLIVREFTAKWAWLAALLAALYPSFTIHSHYATPDVSLTVLSALSFLFVIKFCKTDKIAWLIVATAAAALSVTEKYPCAVNTLVIGVAILYNSKTSWQQKAKLTIGSAIAFLLFLALFSPYLFINFDKVLHAFENESRSVHHGADGLGFFGNIFFYFDQFAQGAGIILLVLSVMGTICSFAIHKRAAAVLLSPIWYLILFGLVPLHWERWGLPIYFALLLNAVVAIAWVLEHQTCSIWLKRAFVFVLSISCTAMLIETLIISHELNSTDARVASLTYCEENRITKENSFYEHYSPLAPQGGSPHGTFNQTTFSKLESNQRYVIISSRMYGRFYLEPERYSKFITGHNELMKYRLVKKFPSTHFTSIWRAPKPKLAILNIKEILPQFYNALFGGNEMYSGTTIHIFDTQNEAPPTQATGFTF